MSPFKVVVTDFGDPDLSPEDAVLRAAGLDYTLVSLQTRVPEEIIPHVGDADAVIVQWASVNRKVIESMQQCKVISRYGIGVDMVDLQAASDCHIPVANVPDFCFEEVSLQTIGFLIDLNRHTIYQNAFVKAGNWGKAALTATPPRRLTTQTLGIVGLGNIGRAVAHKGGALGLKLLGFDPYVDQALLEGLNVEMVGLADLLQRADYVSLHCPLVEETRKLISTAQLAMMKPTAYLINMARGPVVDQAALYDALVKGTIAGAALDVLEKEPPDPADPLLHLENVILAPHASSWGAEALAQLRHDTATNVVEALQGRLPRSIVNRRALGL